MMSYAMASRHGWQWGYRSVGVIQLVLTAVLIFSLPLWKRRPAAADAGTQATDRKPIGLLGVLRISGATQILIMFFCYCAIEQTAMLWASSYMVGMDGMAEDVAATFTSIFLIGITVGRFANGFLTMRFSDPAMIRIGTMTIGLGALLLLVPMHNPRFPPWRSYSSASDARRSTRASSTPRPHTSGPINRRRSSVCRWRSRMWAPCSCHHCSA